MATTNFVTQVGSIVSALDTLITDLGEYHDHNTNSSGAPVVNSGDAVGLNIAGALLNSAHTCRQLLNDPRFQSGANLDRTVTIS
jgi:hypothetical protein